jgi:hypothetical protein
MMLFQYLPLMLYGGSLFQISRIWSIASTNIAVRSLSRLPNTSASDNRPPGLMPNRKRPSAMWSSIATSAATIAGWWFGRFTVPEPSLIDLVADSAQAMKISDEVMVSAASVMCSP